MTSTRSLTRLFLSASVLGTGLTAQADARERYASIVIDAESQDVLHARYADEDRYPASLTKVMTLYMVFEALEAGELSLDERLTVSTAAASMPPSNLRLRAGQTITVSDAIKALVTKSANDVAVVIAERLGGSEERFAALMTVKARMLGLTDTRFYNASGLPDPRQVTTARDMAILADAVMNDHEGYYRYFSTQRFTWNGRTYSNHNALLGEVDGVDGIKTGYTRASGFNLMASAQRDDRRVIAIVMGGKTSRARNDHTADLIEAAYTTLSTPDGLRRPSLTDDVRYTRIESGNVPEPTLAGLEQGSAE